MFKGEFPILQQKIAGKPLIYLDTAASAQKPHGVIEAIRSYYQNDHANAHRGVHTLSCRATAAYESARNSLQRFVNANDSREIIFTRGATESINLVAGSLGASYFQAGNEIVISTMEHHANIVPWQLLCQRTGAVLRVIPLLPDGCLDLVAYEQLLNERTKLVAVTHVSHVLGTINPVKKMIAAARSRAIPVLIDGAQAVGHLAIDVQDLGCDFYVFSGHKMYGPTGIGILYGKSDWLNKMPPYQTGGGMIKRVSFNSTEFAELPAKFEPGTPHIAGAVGLHAAVNFLQQIDFSELVRHEKNLTDYTLQTLQQIPEVQLLPAPKLRAGIVSFTLANAHPHDIATILNNDGIAVRAGHHCAMPLMECLQVPATVRVSFGIYNELPEIDQLAESLKKVIKMFSRGKNG